MNLAADFLADILDDKRNSHLNKIFDETGEICQGTILFGSEAEQIPILKPMKKKMSPSLILTAKKSKVGDIPLVSSANASSTVVQTSTGSATKIDVSSMMTVMQNMSTNEKSYRCSFCGEEIKTHSSMKRHIETKHLPSPDFKCLNCDYSCKQKNNLKRHYMTKHCMPEPAAQGMMLAL